jgi:hypothetical protein
MSPLFVQNGDTDHNRACDAVLIHEYESGKCRIVYIDLKSDVPKGYQGQFQSSHCFMRYIQVLLSEFFQQKLEFDNEKFIIFHTDSSNGRNSINKKCSQFKSKPNSVSSPEKRIVRDDHEVSYNELNF